MKKAFLLGVLFTFLIISIPVFATNIQINASEDTFVTETDGIIGSTNYSSYLNYGNHPVADVFRVKSGGLDTDVRTFLKFQNSQLQTRIIDNLYLNYRGLSNCGQFASRIYLQNNDAWNEYNITFDNKPSLDTSESNAIKGINSTGALNTRVIRLNNAPPPATQNSSQIQFATAGTYYQPNAELIDDLYNSPFTSLETFKTDSCGGILGNGASFAQKEGNSTANISLQISLVDFQTNSNTQATDVTGTFYFDFETGMGSFSSFPQADFSWNSATNVLTPIQPAVLVLTHSDNSNSLSSVSCSAYSPYSFSNIGSLNVPTGSYSVICFDLKNAHSGNQFYGAIKILNNTNVRNGLLSGSEFDFHYALYSSALATFSPPTFNPSPQEASRNLTVTWTTSQNLSTGFRFRFLQNGIFSAFATIENSTQSTNHQIVIPSNLMFATLYEYTLYGTDVNGTAFTAHPANFTAIATFGTGLSQQSGNTTYFDFETQTKSSAFFTGADFQIDSIDNYTQLFTSIHAFNGTLTPYVPKSIVTFEPTTENTLLSLDCRAAPAYNMLQAEQLKPAINAGAFPVFCFDLSGSHAGSQVFGAIKIISMNDTEIGFYWAIYSPNFVTFYSINKNPTVPTATRAETITWQTSIALTSQLQYSYQLANQTGFTAYALIEETAFRTSHAITIPADSMFLGDYNFFLAGTDANGTSYSSPVFNFSVTNQSSGGAIGNPLGNFLGISPEQALTVLGLLATIIATVFVAIQTKSSPVAILTFITGLVLFSAMGWIPIVVMIILGIFAVFIAIKFLADAVAGTQGA